MLEEAGAKLKSSLTAAPTHARPSWEIRMLRFLIALLLVLAALSVLFTVLETDKDIRQANKLEIGMLLGWIIAKSGTVIDWLFGGSESGTRRAEQQAQQANRAPPEGSHSITLPEDSKSETLITTPDPTAPDADPLNEGVVDGEPKEAPFDALADKDR